MSDPATGTGTPAPETQPASPPAPASPPTPVTVSMSSDALSTRLREAESAAVTKFLKEHGFDTKTALKSTLDEHKTLKTATLTEHEKLTARNKELEALATAGTESSTLLNSIIEEQFKTLPEAVQAAIDAQAKGNPAQRYAAMSLIKAAQAVQQSAPSAPGTTAPATPPVTTAPSPAPAPAGAATKFQEWQSMQSRSPLMADIFYQHHTTEIERTRPAN